MKTNQASTLSSKLITRKSVIALAALVVAIVAMIFAIFMQTAKAETNETATVTWTMENVLAGEDVTTTIPEVAPSTSDPGAPNVKMYYKGDSGCQLDSVYDHALMTQNNRGLLMKVPNPDGYSIDSVTIDCIHYNGNYDIYGTDAVTYSSYTTHTVTSDESTQTWTFNPVQESEWWTGDVAFWFTSEDYSPSDAWKEIKSISVTYEKIPTYTVSFAVDSESTGSGFLSAETITDVPKGSIIYGYNNPCTVNSPTWVQLGSCLATADEDSEFISWSPQYQTVESDITVYAKFAKTHTLTIHYKDADGNQLRKDEDKKVAEGETTILYAPSIESYQPEQPYYEYTMGSEDAEFTITYNEVRCDEKVDFNFQKIFGTSQRPSLIKDTRTWDPTYIYPTQPQDLQITFTGDPGQYDRAKVSANGELVISDDMGTTMNYFTIPAPEGTEFDTFSIMTKHNQSLGIPKLTVTDSLESLEHAVSIEIPSSYSYTETKLELTSEQISYFQGKTLYVGLTGTDYTDIYIHDFGFSYNVFKTELTGTVKTDEDVPVEGASVTFTYDEAANEAVSTTTDEDGAYSLILEIGKTGTLTIDCRPAYDAVFTKEMEITEEMEPYSPEIITYSELEIPISPDEDSAYMHQGYHWALYKLVDGEWQFIEDAEITGNCTATIFTGSTFNYEGNATLVNIWVNPNVETDIQRQTWTPISAGEFYDFDSFSYILPGEDPVEMDVDVPLYIEDETFDGTAFTTAYIDNTPPVPPSPDVPGGEGEMIDANAATGDATCAMFAILLVIAGIAGLSIYRIRKQY